MVPQWSNAKEITLNEFIKLIPQWETPKGSHTTIIGDDGHAYGLYQITKIMVDDFNRISGNQVAHVVAFDPLFSARIAKTVLSHYSRQILASGETPNTDHWLYIWNGGGSAWKRVNSPIRDQKQTNLELYKSRADYIINTYKNEQTERKSEEETQIRQGWTHRSWAEVLQLKDWF